MSVDPAADAVVGAIEKLIDLATGEAPGQSGWEDDDARWIGLEDLVDGFLDPLCDPTQGCLPSPPIDISSNANVDTDDALAQTAPRDDQMNPEDYNDILLNKSEWKGQNMDRFGSADEQVACWILVGVLIHEASHQDDNYPFPPGGPHPSSPAAREWHCQEQIGYIQEYTTLSEGKDDPGLSVADLRHIDARLLTAQRSAFHQGQLKDI